MNFYTNAIPCWPDSFAQIDHSIYQTLLHTGQPLVLVQLTHPSIIGYNILKISRFSS